MEPINRLKEMCLEAKNFFEPLLQSSDEVEQEEAKLTLALFKDIEQAFNSYEAQLKSKDEEIYLLKNKNKANLFNKNSKELENDINKFLQNKARSIVAMLFWSVRKEDRLHGAGTTEANTYLNAFNKAYAMLKDNL